MNSKGKGGGRSFRKENATVRTWAYADSNKSWSSYSQPRGKGKSTSEREF